MDFETTARVIEDARDTAVDFGNASCDLVPSVKRIEETEQLLGQRLPESYLWFLRNYGGGSVFGDVIFSISPTYSKDDMSDVAARTLSDRAQGFVKAHEISVCFTDFGEQFLFDASNAAGEYPVVRKTGELRKVVANDFAEFLVKFIREEIS